MNRVILKGRICRDIELKYGQGADAKAYTFFSIAVDRFDKKTDFINCNAFGQTAEFMGKYFTKGQEILLEGRMQVDQAEKDGVKSTFTKVVVERVEFCGKKGDTQDSASANRGDETVVEEDSDLPF